MAERILGDDAFIVSTTDKAGHITYANRTFIELSGYSERELLGRDHSIVRDPGMPRAIFKLMWDALKREEEFLLYIKSRGKDGVAYWGYTTMLPLRDGNGTLTGYFSVRRKPKAGALDVIEPLYRAMCEEERRAPGDAGIQASLSILKNVLAEKGVSYEQFILALQN